MSSHSDSFTASGNSPTSRRKTAVVVDPNQSYLTIREVAALCRVSVSCVRAWRFARKIPFVQLNGKNLLFRRSDIDAFISKHLVPAKEGRAA